MSATAMSPLIEFLRGAAPANAVLTSDSRAVAPGDVFLAMPGQVHDGRRYIPSVVEAGASAVLWEPLGYDWNDAWQIANRPVSGLRALSATLSAE
jgi:UDP-N-acetylmuramoyl-L-alanyl-D-glutamate--2,6-diaminopimelate ligase